jgi:hypothetical protein
MISNSLLKVFPAVDTSHASYVVALQLLTMTTFIVCFVYQSVVGEFVFQSP